MIIKTQAFCLYFQIQYLPLPPSFTAASIPTWRNLLKGSRPDQIGPGVHGIIGQPLLSTYLAIDLKFPNENPLKRGATPLESAHLISKQNQLQPPHLYNSDESSGNRNTCRPPKALVIRNIWAVNASEYQTRFRYSTTNLKPVARDVLTQTYRMVPLSG